MGLEGLLAAAKYLGVAGLGYLAGRYAGLRAPQWLFTLVVAALIAAVASLASRAFLEESVAVLASSLAYAAATMLGSMLAALPLSRLARHRGAAESRTQRGFAVIALASLAAGVAAGCAGLRAPPGIIDPLLVVLVFLAGLDLGRHRGLRPEAWMLALPFASLAGALAAGAALAPLVHAPLAVAAGMGWYTFTAPYLLAATHNAYTAAVALLANLAREQATIVLVPLASRRLPLPAAVAAGGVTTMDTTLPVYTASYGPRGTLAAVTNGAVLTLLVPVLVPLLA